MNPQILRRDDSEQDHLFQVAVEARASQIADQIRADILVPITDEFIADRPTQAAALTKRRHRAYAAWDWFTAALAELSQQDAQTMQRKMGLHFYTALGHRMNELHDKCIDAYAKHIAPMDVETAAKEAARDCDRCEYQ